MLRSQSDGDLIRDGEPEDFGIIFERHYGEIYRYLARRSKVAVAEDLASETFVRALSLRQRFDKSQVSALPWLLGIATNLLRQQWREETRELKAQIQVSRDVTNDAFVEADERLDAIRDQHRIAVALASLTTRERDVLLLSAWFDLSPQEIAAGLGRRRGTVRSQLARGRRKMTQQLAASREY